MEEVKTRAPRRMKIALVTSLAVNVLIIGALAGAMSHGGDRGGRKLSDRESNAAIGIYGRALERKDRRAIGMRLRDGRKEEGREIRAELRDLAQEASELLKGPAFNKESFSQILLKQQMLIKGRSDAMQEELVEHISSMEPAQRIAYAERLQEVLQRGNRKLKRDNN